MLILDSGAFTRLSSRTPAALGLVRALTRAGLWPPVVPSMVLVESLRGDNRHDVTAHRFLKTCVVHDLVPTEIARRAADLRRRARTGSAVDALVVALAEPEGIVLTGDRGDIEALAAHAHGVAVEVI